MSRPILTLELRQQQDVVLARQRARHIAALLGFEAQDQARLATAVSEIARNACQYAGAAKAEFAVDGEPPHFLITIHDRGPGIKDLKAVLEGQHASTTGRGQGISGVRRLMDRFQIESVPGDGTKVVFGKVLPKRGAGVRDLAHIAEELARRAPHDPFEEVREQNRELLRTLDELRQRQAELGQAHEELQRRESALSQLNQELEDTNRGVVALYAELEEKADFLGRASEMKSLFLSNMSHEFRTPLNAVTGLARLLLDRTDGALTPEQEKQVSLIRRAAESLTELVNDLLDLAKVEAGKVTVRPTEFDIETLFGGLRGMLRPLLSANSSVALVFEEPAGLPVLHTDESKVSQILRNLLSNALKFTEKGEIRVSARASGTDEMIFSVADTGIGIAAEDHQRIFEEFAQVEGPHQKRAKGTGLGLPLVKKLAGLLGGRISLESTLGAGSTFRVTLPRVYSGPTEVSVVPDVPTEVDPARKPVLVVEDNREALFIYDKYLKGTGFQVIPAPNLRAARKALAQFRPYAVVLDVLLDHESGWELLTELKQSESTRDIPVFVITLVENEAKALSLGAAAYRSKPVDRAWLLYTLTMLGTGHTRPKALIIDDDEASRYLLKGYLGKFEVMEATSAADGLNRAFVEHPSLIFLDLELPDAHGQQVLEELRATPAVRHIPIIINTSKILQNDEREHLTAAGAAAILSKESLARGDGLAQLQAALRAIGLAT